MSPITLTLFSRSGCCLCDGLEQRLRSIPLNKLDPSVSLKVIDIDQESVPNSQRVKYDLRVPVLAFSLVQKNRIIELPRVSPRLKEKELMFWLQKMINKIFE